MALNIADLFEHAVDAVPDNPAVKVLDRVITYAELEQESNKLAHYLASQGVEPGDHVGIYAKNSVEHVVAVLAVVKIRAVNINVNYRYVEGELNYLFDNADVKALIFERPYAPIVANCAPNHAQLTTFVAIPDVTDPGNEADISAFGGVTLEEATADQSAERDFPERSAPTTCTSSTPAARPASPRASCGATRTSGGCSAAASTSTPASRSPSSTSPSRPSTPGWSPSRSAR